MSKKLLEAATKRRDNIIAQLEALANYASEFDAESSTYFDARIRLDALNKLHKEFDPVHDEVCVNSSIDSEAANKKVMLDFYKTFYKVHAVLSEETAKYNIEVPQSPNLIKTEPYPEILNLPPIKIPTFAGGYENWLIFKETFESLIGNANIDPIRKLHYLLGYLEKDALKVVGKVEMTKQGFFHAWQSLCDRYDNKRLMVESHVKELFSVKPPSKDNPTELRNLLDSMLTNLRTLEYLQQPIDKWDTLLIHMVTMKLDESTLKAWNSSIDHKTLPTWLKFTEFLQQRIRTLEMQVYSRENRYESSEPNSPQTQVNQPQNSPNSNTQKPQSSKTLLTKHKSCLICNTQGHDIYSCDTFKHNLNATQRLMKVKDLQLCHNCLGSAHNTIDCTSKWTCRTCSRKHHTLLHEALARPKSSNDLQSFSNMQQTPPITQSQLNTQSNCSASHRQAIPCSTQSLTHNCCTQLSGNTHTQCCPPLTQHSNISQHNSFPHQSIYTSSNPNTTPLYTFPNNSKMFASLNNSTQSQNVLLCTVRLLIKNNFGKFIECRALLDNCSQVNSISERLANSLGLQRQKTSHLISALSGMSTQISHKTETQIKSCNGNFSQSLEFLIVPEITSHVPEKTIDISSWKIPRNCTLADPNFNVPDNIDLLLSAGTYFNSLIKGEPIIHIGENLPVLQNTEFGWIIGGSYLENTKIPISFCHFIKIESPKFQLKHNWENEVNNHHTKQLTAEERKDENHMHQTYSNYSSERYIVQIPTLQQSITNTSLQYSTNFPTFKFIPQTNFTPKNLNSNPNVNPPNQLDQIKTHKTHPHKIVKNSIPLKRFLKHPISNSTPILREKRKHSPLKTQPHSRHSHNAIHSICKETNDVITQLSAQLNQSKFWFNTTLKQNWTWPVQIQIDSQNTANMKYLKVPQSEIQIPQLNVHDIKFYTTTEVQISTARKLHEIPSHSFIDQMCTNGQEDSHQNFTKAVQLSIKKFVTSVEFNNFKPQINVVFYRFRFCEITKSDSNSNLEKIKQLKIETFALAYLKQVSQSSQENATFGTILRCKLNNHSGSSRNLSFHNIHLNCMELKVFRTQPPSYYNISNQSATSQSSQSSKSFASCHARTSIIWADSVGSPRISKCDHPHAAFTREYYKLTILVLCFSNSNHFYEPHNTRKQSHYRKKIIHNIKKCVPITNWIQTTSLSTPSCKVNNTMPHCSNSAQIQDTYHQLTEKMNSSLAFTTFSLRLINSEDLPDQQLFNVTIDCLYESLKARENVSHPTVNISN